MRQHCALKHGILKEFLAEFLGTFVLVVSSILFDKIVVDGFSPPPQQINSAEYSMYLLDG